VSSYSIAQTGILTYCEVRQQRLIRHPHTLHPLADEFPSPDPLGSVAEVPSFGNHSLNETFGLIDEVLVHERHPVGHVSRLPHVLA
jgi:hypothetical protein